MGEKGGGGKLTQLASLDHVLRQDPREACLNDLGGIPVDEGDLAVAADLCLVGLDVPLVEAVALAVLEQAVPVDDGALLVPAVVGRLEPAVGALDLDAKVAPKLVLHLLPRLLKVHVVVDDPQVLLKRVLFVDVRRLRRPLADGPAVPAAPERLLR